MNTKRQTIWLVSMLSIMVVLSAYYLFTDDVEEMKVASDEQMTHESILDTINSGSTEIEEITESIDETKTEEEILQGVQAQNNSASSYFTSLYLDRDEALTEEMNELYSIIVDGSAEAQAIAYDDLSKIEDREMKLTYLEGQLMKDFENAIILEEGNKWTVLIQTDKMEKSQANSIFDMVMEEMNVGPNQVEVQMKR